jgi:hypothetical protein
MHPAPTASQKPWSTIARSQGSKRSKGQALSPVQGRCASRDLGNHAARINGIIVVGYSVLELQCAIHIAIKDTLAPIWVDARVEHLSCLN